VTFDQFILLLQTVAFPVIVAAYLLWRLEIWMQQLTQISAKLDQLISAQIATLALLERSLTHRP
jgi:hypothetical protein